MATGGGSLDPVPWSLVHCGGGGTAAAGVAGTGTIIGVFVPGVLFPPGLLPGVGGAGVRAGVLGCPSAGNPGVVGPNA